MKRSPMSAAAAGSMTADEDPPCPRGVSCRTVTVPLDRSGRVAGEIPMHVGLLRTRGAARASPSWVTPTRTWV